MTTLQEYLNEKYPTREDKDKVKEIVVWEILMEGKEREKKLEKGGKEREKKLEEIRERRKVVKEELNKWESVNFKELSRNEKLAEYFQSLLDLSNLSSSKNLDNKKSDEIAPLELEGGELDLSEFLNVEIVDIDRGYYS